MNNSELKWKQKEKKQFSDECWYREVCSDLNCENCIKYLEMRFLMDSSGIPKAKQRPVKLIPDDCDYDKFVTLDSVKKDIKEFVELGGNLFICSKSTGNGKTSWALKLLMHFFEEVWDGNGLQVRGLFIHVPTLLLQLKNFSNPLSEEYKRQILNVDLVVWDEIASSNVSQYDYQNLLMFLENRLLNDKANIFTSNSTTLAEVTEAVGAKIASRLWNWSDVIEFKGKDRRSNGNS